MKGLIKGTFQVTGNNELDIPKIIKLWDDRFIIYQWKDEYTLIVYRKNSGSTLFKSSISKEDAKTLIESVGLKQYQGIFNSSSAWNTHGYEIRRKW